MKTADVACSGDIHEIGIDEDGDLHLLDHDIDEEETFYHLGVDVSDCYQFIYQLQVDPGKVLVRAAKENDYDIVELALLAGANANTHAGLALLRAMQNDNLKMVKLLVEHGVSFRYISDGEWFKFAALHPVGAFRILRRSRQLHGS